MQVPTNSLNWHLFFLFPDAYSMMLLILLSSLWIFHISITLVFVIIVLFVNCSLIISTVTTPSLRVSFIIFAILTAVLDVLILAILSLMFATITIFTFSSTLTKWCLVSLRNCWIFPLSAQLKTPSLYWPPQSEQSWNNNSP